MNLRKLSLVLSQLNAFKNPKSVLEQWQTPGRIAAEILFEVKRRGDLSTVADFGCGTGIFAIGAALLGAEKVFAVDKDPEAIEIAKKNAKSLGLSISFLISDISDFKEQVHTVIQNPPFGTVNPKEDTLFLKKALSVAKVVYTLHPHPSGTFINRLPKRSSELLATYKFPLKRTQSFHRKPKSEVACDLWRVES